MKGTSKIVGITVGGMYGSVQRGSAVCLGCGCDRKEEKMKENRLESEANKVVNETKENEEISGIRENGKMKRKFSHNRSNRHEGKRKRTLLGCFPAKVAAFFLLAVSSFFAAACVISCGLALSEELYVADNVYNAFMDFGYGLFRMEAVQVNAMLQYGDNAEEELKRYFEGSNLDIDILYKDAGTGSGDKGRLIWGTYNGSYWKDLFTDIYLRFDEGDGEVKVGGTTISTKDTYIFRVYVNPNFPHNDRVSLLYEAVWYLYGLRYEFIWVGLIAVCVAILCFIFLMCSAGHSNWREETGEKAPSGIWLDVLAAVLFLTAVPALILAHDMLTWIDRWEIYMGVLIIGVLAAILVLFVTVFSYEAARHIKYGKWWQHTLIYVLLKLCFKALRFLGGKLLTVMGGLPTVFITLFGYLGICLLEFLGIGMFMRPHSEGMLLWLFEKVVLLLAVLYVALVCKRLLRASRALAEGQQGYKVDTSMLIGDFKEHGVNLNSIGEGITKAVEARMKSERLKTELITNVSHDLKTPLTSIINYSDLICEEETENERIREYSQVLKRQSGRLKKLLEDLVEASKATTGNLEVNPVLCEVGVILSQAVGEYQPKLEEKELELRITQPDAPVQIMADGRHLWRVFDNLFNNICKYAQEGTRVYLNVELLESQVKIIFRNMSRYPLNMSGEELEERFVRGDRSRHMEGNGLGLSIAKSLIELQGGEMEIITDGDLFKVTIGFKTIS